MPKKKTDNHIAEGIGAGLAIAAIAVSAWLYGTKKGQKTKKKLESWMLKAKGDVLEKIEKMDEVTEDSYKKAVKDVMGKYKKMKKVSTKEAEKLEKQLERHWNSLKPKKKVTKKKK